MRSLSLLPLLALVSSAVAQDTADAFDFDQTPAFRGAANADYAGWDNFSVPFGASNASDDSATDMACGLSQTTPGAIITSTQNIYSPGTTSTFEINATANGTAREVVLQLRSLGNLLDDASYTLSYSTADGPVSLSAARVETLNPFPGFAAERLVEFAMPAEDDVTTFTIGFAASDTNCSLDAVMLDVLVEGQVGTSYCTANPNSTGVVGELEAFGSDIAADNSLELRLSNLPANQFGIYIVSATQAFVPGLSGSQGNLCVGGAIGRFNGQIFDSGATGSNETVIDLTQLPIGNAPVAAQSGDTWNFQAWHRDVNPTATSNLTTAVSITFN